MPSDEIDRASYGRWVGGSMEEVVEHDTVSKVISIRNGVLFEKCANLYLEKLKLIMRSRVCMRDDEMATERKTQC